MRKHYFQQLALTGLAGLSALASACAQAPGWAGLAVGIPPQVNTACYVKAVAADASGNLVAVGGFTGSVTFGSTTLTSRGNSDLFVAKYVPATNTWAWAQSGGGTGSDWAQGVAVVGSSIFVAGYLTNNADNANNVLLATGGAPGLALVRGASLISSNDVLLARYTDQGSTAALDWVQVGGGTGDDQGQGVTASGSSVYVTGTLTNTLSNAAASVFGGNGTVAGTAQVNGASSNLAPDLLLLKYTDQGSTGSYQWSQVGGGTSSDGGAAVAVSNNSVYVAGYLTNNIANTYGVVLGGGGTTPGTARQNGVGAASTVSTDVALLKYTDNGATGTFGWSQVGGGNQSESGTGVAVSGRNVYVAGTLYNNSSNANAVLFGGTGTTAGTRPQYGAGPTSGYDVLLAKYTDNGATGTFGWSQVGGGSRRDEATGVAVRGSSVYVVGFLTNSSSNANGVLFGGSGTTAGTVAVPGLGSTAYGDDLLLARYTDDGAAGSFQWGQVGGGYYSNQGSGVVVTGASVWAGGYATSGSRFGSYVVDGSSANYTAVLAQVADPALPVQPVQPAPAAPALCPNPASGAVTLSGALPGAAVQVFDALGRLAATATADAAGTARLASLAPGLYLVRSGGSAVRLAVE